MQTIFSQNHAQGFSARLLVWAACAAAAGTASTAQAQCFSYTQNSPTLDRWVYPFAGTPGTETTCPTYGAILITGFDDRDAQMLLGWDTGLAIPAGLSPERYDIRRVRVTAWIAIGDKFYYDNTRDLVTSLYATNDPQYTPDPDLGRPVELFAVGYRNGETSATFGEYSAFSPFPPFPLQEGVRSAFAAVYDESGVATDLSRQVELRFDATPMAYGIADGVTPGTKPPAGTAMTFDVNLNAPGARAYLQSCLADGRMRLMLSSLQPASGGPGGGSGDYPVFYTKENVTATLSGWTPRLEIEVAVAPDTDLNQDGNVDQGDVSYLVDVVAGGENTTGIDPDLNQDGNVDQGDIDTLVNLVAGGSVCN